MRRVQRQAFAGMIWSKQFYYFDVRQWLNGDPLQPPPPREPQARPQLRVAAPAQRRHHLDAGQVGVSLVRGLGPRPSTASRWRLIDPEFAKEQLVLLLREWYMHPNGQLPAYEWAFGDVNPPVHAWAALAGLSRSTASSNGGAGDLDFLERVFHKLMLNFTWWVNRKDAQGRNIFQGGFLGLDNIGVFDRSAPLPTGGYIDQSDGTAWMAMYCLNLMRIALELAQHDPVYEDIATKFFEHFLYIAEAMTNIGGEGIGLWDDEDEFFYDVLCLPRRTSNPAAGALDGRADPAVRGRDRRARRCSNKLPEFSARSNWFREHRPDLATLVSRWNEPGADGRRLLAAARPSA